MPPASYDDVGSLDDATIDINDEASSGDSGSDEEGSVEGTAAANTRIEVEVDNDSILS